MKAGENTFTTTLSLGGIRIGNADATTPDAVWTTTGFGRQDGAYLKEAMAFGKKASVEVGFGAFNNIVAYANPVYPSTGNTTGGYSWSGSASTKQANWESTSFSQSIGFAGHLAANVNIDDEQSLALKGFFGTQGNSPTNQDSNGTLLKQETLHTWKLPLFITMLVFLVAKEIFLETVSAFTMKTKISEKRKQLQKIPVATLTIQTQQQMTLRQLTYLALL